jgi:hypothetical protein
MDDRFLNRPYRNKGVARQRALKAEMEGKIAQLDKRVKDLEKDLENARVLNKPVNSLPEGVETGTDITEE